MIKATYIDHMGDDLRTVNSARISFANEKEELDERDKKLIEYLADNEHYSPFEHNMATFIIECPLYIRSQIQRHRTFSYNEVSRRYTKEDLVFYVPPVDDIRKQSKSNKQASEGTLDNAESMAVQELMKETHDQCLAMYEEFLKWGVSREQARGILPQNLMTKFYMTGNLRNWAHFVKLRKHHHAQKEVQVIALQVEEKLGELFPESMKALMEE